MTASWTSESASSSSTVRRHDDNFWIQCFLLLGCGLFRPEAKRLRRINYRTDVNGEVHVNIISCWGDGEGEGFDKIQKTKYCLNDFQKRAAGVQMVTAK
jgi:hypothetical protein